MKGGGRAPGTLRAGALLAVAGIVATLGCSASRRHKVLTIFFDGVPPLAGDAAPGSPSGPSPAEPPPAVARLGGHGPYAARMCQSCHASQLTNALVVPREQLCYRCHEIPLTARYVHGPLASGGCTACHDPHSSPNRYLLVSATDTFCFSCHEERDLSASPAHEGAGDRCTDCHDAHMSDREHLLK